MIALIIGALLLANVARSIYTGAYLVSPGSINLAASAFVGGVMITYSLGTM